MPACAHVAQSVCLQVPYDMHIRTATSACGCAHPQQGGGQKKRHGRGRHQRCILRATCDVWVHSHNRDRGCGLPRSRSSSVLFCQHCCQQVATALPCPPCRTSPRCSLLCRGRVPQLRSIQDAAKSQSSPGPPGRLRLLCVCVCVLGDVMFLCRLMCILLSGRPPSAMRLLPRSVVLAAVLLSLSASV